MMRWSTRFVNRFPCGLPIFGAPMHGCSGGLLAAETCRAGALGSIAAGHLTMESIPRLEKEIEIFRNLQSKSPLCLGFVGHSTFGETGGPDEDERWERFRSVVSVHRPEVVQFFGPAISKRSDTAETNVDVAKSYGAQVIAQVGTVADARNAINLGVDAVIAQGSEAGGHGVLRSMGSGTLSLASQIVHIAEGKVPVLAAGGIVNGRGLAAALALGCDGVVLGTRLWASKEALGKENYKEAMVRAESCDDVVRTESFDMIWNAYRPVKWPLPYSSSGALRNETTDHWDTRLNLLRDELEGDQVPSWVETFRQGDERGDPSIGAVLCGEGVGEIDEILPAYDIVASIDQEAKSVIADLPKAVLI